MMLAAMIEPQQGFLYAKERGTVIIPVKVKNHN